MHAEHEWSCGEYMLVTNNNLTSSKAQVHEVCICRLIEL